MDRERPSFAPGSIVVATNDDCILGRGGGHVSHPGNLRFYEQIEKHLDAYEAAGSRRDKSRVVQAIYDDFTRGGRFVKYNRGSRTFVVASHSSAKCKISHAMRYKLKIRRRELVEAVELFANEKGEENDRQQQGELDFSAVDSETQEESVTEEGEQGNGIPTVLVENQLLSNHAGQDNCLHLVVSNNNFQQSHRRPSLGDASTGSSAFSDDLLESALGRAGDFDVSEHDVVFEPLE